MKAEGGPTTVTAGPPAGDEPSAEPLGTILCPGCGYDLRATSGDRCSECGLVIDREALKRSAFPWAHRRRIGRVRAFLKTVWLVTIDSKLLSQETAKAQSPKDAAAFRRWVAAALALCFAGAVVMLIESGAMADAMIDRSLNLPFYTRWPGLAQDLAVPWSAGVVWRPALFAYAALLAFYVAGATRPIFRTRGMSLDYADTVGAIGTYASAPLALILLGAAGYAAVATLETYVEIRFIARVWLPAAITVIVSFLLLIFGVVLTVYRTGQWRARTAHAGYPTGFAAMGELLIRWIVGCVVILGILPWCVGFGWIVIDSFL